MSFLFSPGVWQQKLSRSAPVLTHIAKISYGYFVPGDSSTGRMIPTRQAHRVLTKLALADIDAACNGGSDEMPLGERLLWRRWSVGRAGWCQ